MCIFINNETELKSCVERLEKSTLNEKNDLEFKFLTIVNKIVKNIDYSADQLKYIEYLKKDIKITWYTEELEEWLIDVELDSNKKSRIQEVLDKLNEKKRKQSEE